MNLANPVRFSMTHVRKQYLAAIEGKKERSADLNEIDPELVVSMPGIQYEQIEHYISAKERKVDERRQS